MYLLCQALRLVKMMTSPLGEAGHVGLKISYMNTYIYFCSYISTGILLLIIYVNFWFVSRFLLVWGFRSWGPYVSAKFTQVYHTYKPLFPAVTLTSNVMRDPRFNTWWTVHIQHHHTCVWSTARRFKAEKHKNVEIMVKYRCVTADLR